jgi:hypothetical protein
MTTRDVMFVGARLLALWLFVSSVAALSAAPAMDWGEAGEMRYMQLFAVVALVLVPLLIAVPLWVKSAWLANRVSLDGQAGVTVTEPFGTSQLFSLGVSLLGLIVIVQVLPELAQWGAFVVAARFVPHVEEPIDTTLQLQRWVYLQAGIARGVSLVVRLAVGIVLLLGPARVWHKLTGYGRRYFSPVLRDDVDSDDGMRRITSGCS